MSYKNWKEFKFDKEVKQQMYFGKVEDYIAQPDPILVNSEEEALEDIHSRKVAQMSQLKDKVVDAYVSLNEIAQDIMFLNNHHIQPYRDEKEWFKGQEKIANLPQDPDELVSANKMWEIEAEVKRYASDKEAHITNFDQLRELARGLGTDQIKDLEKLNTLLDAILRLPKVHIEIKESQPPF